MKVAFLVNDLHLSGGVATVIRHASLLRRRSAIEAELVLARPASVPVWNHQGLESVPVHSLAEARLHRYDVAVATWWETAGPLFELDARRHAYFVQSLEDRFYDRERVELAFEARGTYDLPVSFVTEALWIAETLRRLRPDAPCYYVRNGVDKHVFGPVESVEARIGGPLRILIEGRPEVWFKGVLEALHAANLMREDRHVTLVSPSKPAPGADRVLSALSADQLARVYAECDVLLKLSRVEGMYGPPLEAFHRGATCVTTPVTGHLEYIVHGWNAMVVNWDDPRGTAGVLDLLARDRRLLHFLRTNALASARAWPSWEQSSQFMTLALESIGRRREASSPHDADKLRRARLEVLDLLATETGVPSPGSRRSQILRRLWTHPSGARLLHAYGGMPKQLRRVIRPVIRRLLR